jgi:hypothetical protein
VVRERARDDVPARIEHLGRQPYDEEERARLPDAEVPREEVPEVDAGALDGERAVRVRVMKIGPEAVPSQDLDGSSRLVTRAESWPLITCRPSLKTITFWFCSPTRSI